MGDEWIKQRLYFHTPKYYSAIKSGQMPQHGQILKTYLVKQSKSKSTDTVQFHSEELPTTGNFKVEYKVYWVLDGEDNFKSCGH